MSFLSNILPESFFGVPMPWAHHEAPVQPAVNTVLPDVTKETTPTEEVQAPLPESLQDSLIILAAELCLRFQKKAAALHEEIKAKHAVIKNIDDLLALLAERAQTRPDGKPNSDGTIDCRDPAIRSLITSLRAEGVKVPLPDGVMSQADRNNAVTVLMNQRGLVSDEEREKGQEFHQCASEQNSFFQTLMSVAETLHRILMKLIGSFGGHGAL